MSANVPDSDEVEQTANEMEQAATETLPEDVEAAVLEAPEPDALPAVAVAYSLAAAGGAAVGAAVGDAATDAVLNTVTPYITDETELGVSKRSSVDDLLDHYEQKN